MSKILVGVPTYSGHKYCFDEFAEGLKQTITADILFVVNNGEDAYMRWIKSKGFHAVENPKPAKEPKEHILNNRNYLRDYFLGLDYDYLLLVSSDVILPKKTLEVLILQKKDIVAGAYLNLFKLDQLVVAPKMFKDKGNGEAQLYTYKGMFPGRLEQIGAAGLGCVLLSRNALEKTKFEANDIMFYVNARKNGLETYGLTAVRCTHRVHPKENEMSKHFEWNTNYEDNVWEIDSKEIFNKRQ